MDTDILNHLTLIKEHDGLDICHLKIYYDSKTKQYKHRFRCPKCNDVIDCYCFDDLDSAVDDVVGFPIYCYYDWIRINLVDNIEEYADYIDARYNTHIRDILIKINMIENDELYAKASEEYKSDTIDAAFESIRKIIDDFDNKTLDKFSNEFESDFDDFDGSSCDLSE